MIGEGEGEGGGGDQRAKIGEGEGGGGDQRARVRVRTRGCCAAMAVATGPAEAREV